MLVLSIVKLQVLNRIIFLSDPPQIHLHVQVAKAPIGERVHLNCTARGNPTPNVTWYRGQAKIDSGFVILSIHLTFVLNSLILGESKQPEKMDFMKQIHTTKQ